MELTKELVAKAKEAKTPEELMALAKENGVGLTEEEAKAYFDRLHPQTGELSDSELDNVSGGCGGGTKIAARRTVTAVGRRLNWRCPVCKNDCWEENGYRWSPQQKWWYCCVCQIRKGSTDVTNVQQPGNRADFPVAYVTVEM